MEHFKSRNNDYFHFTNPHDDISELDDDDDDNDIYDESEYYDADEAHSCDFNFHTYCPLAVNRSTPANSQTSGVMNRNDTVEFGAFDNGALIFQLENTMKDISDKLMHSIEGIGTRISHLENETCKLDNYVEDVKKSDERYHGTTHRKLRRMQSILQEVQDGVLFVRDKYEIAETQLQLAILRGSTKDKVNIAPRSSCSTPFLNQQANEVNLSQTVSSYHPIVFQAHELPAQQYAIPPNQQFHAPQFPHFVYMPEFASFSNTHIHSELSSLYGISNVKPLESFLHPQEESSRNNYIHTPVAQTLPHALPTAIDVKEESISEENWNTIPVDDIVEKVTGMGFRRDLVRACVRKLTVNGSRVDLNSVLHKMLNKDSVFNV